MDFWLTQGEEPLFPDIRWSRPETRRNAGKLLIIGGHAHAFSAPVNSYAAALEAGAGTIRVVLPGAVGKAFSEQPDVYLLASTPSGSFAKSALAELLDFAEWADGVLLAGDFGHNSETAVLLERFVNKYGGLLTVSGDAVDYFYGRPGSLLQRPQTLIVATTAQLQKLLIQHGSMRPIYSGMSLAQLVETLHGIETDCDAHLASWHEGTLVASADASVSSTAYNQEAWRLQYAAAATVWWLQNPHKPFEALTTAAFELARVEK